LVELASYGRLGRTRIPLFFSSFMKATFQGYRRLRLRTFQRAEVCPPYPSCSAFGCPMRRQSRNQRGKSTKKCRKPPFSCCFCFPTVANMRYPAALRVSRRASCNPAPRNQGTGRAGRKCPHFGGFLATSRKLDRRPAGLARERCRGRSSGRPCSRRASIRRPDGRSKRCSAHNC
jgi:hypothetical protein